MCGSVRNVWQYRCLAHINTKTFSWMPESLTAVCNSRRIYITVIANYSKIYVIYYTCIIIITSVMCNIIKITTTNIYNAQISTQKRAVQESTGVYYQCICGKRLKHKSTVIIKTKLISYFLS